jgi:integrase/recombinase XerC
MEGAGIASLAEAGLARKLRAFNASEHRRGLSPASLQRRLSAVRSLGKHLVARGELKGNPAQGLRAPKSARKLPQVLDPDENRAAGGSRHRFPAGAPRSRHARTVLFLRPAPVGACARCAGASST